LLDEGEFDRKLWIEKRAQELSKIFAVSVGGFSVMDNHLHLLVRLDPDVATGWSDEEVVRRWGRLFPPRDKSREPLPVSSDWVEWPLQDVQWVAMARARLASLSWFMKCLKEPLMFLILLGEHGLIVTFGKNRHTRPITFTTKPRSDYAGATP
jgi:hypothetical protein